MLLLHEFKERLGKQCDPDTFIDILGLSIEELMDAFEERIPSNYERFDEVFDIYGEDYDPR